MWDISTGRGKGSSSTLATFKNISCPRIRSGLIEETANQKIIIYFPEKSESNKILYRNS